MNFEQALTQQLKIVRSTNIERHMLAIIDARVTDIGLPVEQIESINENDLHVMAAIGKLQHPKIGEVVEQLPLTQGAVSKIIRKLADLNLIEKSHNPDNKKDTYLTLLPAGRKIDKLHQQYHATLNAKIAEMVNEFDESERTTILDFLTKYNQIHGE